MSTSVKCLHSIFVSHEIIAYSIEEVVSFAGIGIHWNHWVEHSQRLLRKVLEQLNCQFSVEMAQLLRYHKASYFCFGHCIPSGMPFERRKNVDSLE